MTCQGFIAPRKFAVAIAQAVTHDDSEPFTLECVHAFEALASVKLLFYPLGTLTNENAGKRPMLIVVEPDRRNPPMKKLATALLKTISINLSPLNFIKMKCWLRNAKIRRFSFDGKRAKIVKS